jgi:hypothetical protein
VQQRRSNILLHLRREDASFIFRICCGSLG